jgi:predicted metal-dependent HD superfamily phosphohydrolase
MFENYFKEEVESVSNDKSLQEKLWTEIKLSYGSSKRYYHNLYHLDSIIRELSIVREQINDWHTLVFSVAYHDIIYDAVKKDNEERSASLSYTRLTELGLPELQKEKCRLQILATKNHNINVEEDTNYFTDADLSILGVDPHYYLKYCEEILKHRQGSISKMNWTFCLERPQDPVGSGGIHFEKSLTNLINVYSGFLRLPIATVLFHVTSW